MNPWVDPSVESAISAVMACAPLDCKMERDCFRVARYARDAMRRENQRLDALQKRADALQEAA